MERWRRPGSQAAGMFAVPYWNGSRPDTGHCAIDDPNLHHQNQTLLTINCLKFKLMIVCSLPVYYRLFNVNLYCWNRVTIRPKRWFPHSFNFSRSFSTFYLVFPKSVFLAVLFLSVLGCALLEGLYFYTLYSETISSISTEFGGDIVPENSRACGKHWV